MYQPHCGDCSPPVPEENASTKAPCCCWTLYGSVCFSNEFLFSSRLLLEESGILFASDPPRKERDRDNADRFGCSVSGFGSCSEACWFPMVNSSKIGQKGVTINESTGTNSRFRGHNHASIGAE